MSRAVQLFPYALSTALELRLDDFEDPTGGAAVDVRVIGPAVDAEEAPESGASGYDACSGGTGWRKLAFRATVCLDRAELVRVLPDTSSLDDDTSLIVLMTCPSTRFRHGVRLARTGGTTWSGYASIQREDVIGAVSLRPQLVRTTSIPADESLPYATATGSVVAIGEAVTVFVDVQPRMLHSTVLMFWEDFANSEHPWRREHPDDVFHLEPFAEPRLYLNSRYTQIRQIMDSNARRGPEASLRDLTAAMVAQPVLIQLATSALVSLERDDDSGAVVAPGGWKSDLLASVLPRLYPEAPDEDARLQRAASDVRDPEGAAGLISRLGSVAQEMIGSYKTIELAIRNHEAGREREEAWND